VPRAFLAAAVVALAACGGTGRPLVPQVGPTVKTDAGIARPYGHGSSEVWVLTPRAVKPRSIVVYIHGFTATSPFDWHQVWLDHLLARGAIVVFPVYQTSGDIGEFVTARLDLRAGLRTAFRVLRERDLPVVVAGYSLGAALAFFYAADARWWGVPAPSAVYSVFPVDPLGMDPGLLHLAPPPRIPALILVGDRDDTVGRLGADAFWKWLRPVPTGLKTYRLLHSDPKGLFFDHESPHGAAYDPALQRVFWRPLDELVDAAERSGGT
jgi:pimeloyl-ACP methyl ester carboxylesterase